MNRYGTGRFKFARKHNIFSPIQWFAGAAVVGFFLLLLISFLSSPVFEVLRSLTAFYLLIVVAFSAVLAVKENHLGCLLYGPVIFPAIHFGLGMGFLKGVYGKFKKV